MMTGNFSISFSRVKNNKLLRLKMLSNEWNLEKCIGSHFWVKQQFMLKS